VRRLPRGLLRVCLLREIPRGILRRLCEGSRSEEGKMKTTLRSAVFVTLGVYLGVALAGILYEVLR
jgi:hypothetical protein